MDKEIIIEYKPNIETLMRVSKYLFFNLSFIKFSPIYIIVMVLLNNFSDQFNENLNLEDGSKISYLFIIPLVILFLIYSYYRTISTMKKNILKNKRNFELQNITFNKNSYLQKGETFQIENFWSETYQIKETHTWFLIYPKKFTAFPIVKSDLKYNQYNELKALFNSLNIKKSLK